jgi:hypothetical protein
MTPEVPGYVSIVFILTALLTVGIFIYSVSKAGGRSLPAMLLIGYVLFWSILQSVLAAFAFFQDFSALPPRTFMFGPLPFFVLTFAYVIFAPQLIKALPLGPLTLIHVIRIPIELVLFWLYQNGLVPVEMTFEGRNFDILSGITAPIVYFLAFRGDKPSRPLLIIWNVAALALLANIVTIAILAFPSPFQMVGIDQPNVGVTFFPFIWLPAVIVPIVFFCHVASLYKLISGIFDTADRPR